MELDSQKCPDCGKPFQSPTGADAVCECSRSVQPPPSQPERGIVYLLPCPKCGDQKHALASFIGTAEKCQCGYEFRYSLVLSPLRPETVGWMPTIQHHATVWTQKSLHWWRQSAVPWMKRTVTFIREHVIPGIVAATISAWNWLTDRIGSLFTAPPQRESEFRDVRQEPTRTDTNCSESTASSEHKVTGVWPPVIESTRFKDFFTPSTVKIAEDENATQPSSESRNLCRLARQMMGAGLCEEAYANASRAVVLDPSNIEAWATKGIAAAYTSKPPEFRFKEARFCLTEALASTHLVEFVPSFSQHLIAASAKYRKLLRQSCQDADDDASKEPLAGNVDVGLQLSSRNTRVSRVQTEKHRAGYFASIDTIKYAVELNPSLQLLIVGLKEIDNILSNASFPGFVDFLSKDGKRAQVLKLREGFVSQIRQINPAFTPPEPPKTAGCFIATAAAGDEFHPTVCTLRRFRDVVLQRSSVGRKLVHVYYDISPPIASAISRSHWMRRLVFATVVIPLSTAASMLVSKHRPTSKESMPDYLA